MSRASRLLAPLAALALVAAPGPARAAFFAGEVIDGPSPDIVRVGGVDLARDGSGAVVYVKRDGGVEHVFAARMRNGAWQPPERLDTGAAAAASDPVVAAAGGGQLVAAYVSGGQLFTVVRPAGANAWSAPVALASGAQTPAADLSTNGVGYVAWASGGDVRAARLDRGASAFTPLAAPLDVDPAADAGSGTGRPRIAVSADGTALAAWGEAGRVYARRLLRLELSQVPQEVSVPSFAGHGGGAADTPVVDVADDSSFAWVAFREAFDGGATTRVLARRLVGSAFDPPFSLSGPGFAGEAAASPALDVAGTGDAIFAADGASSHTPLGALLYVDAFGAPFPAGAPSAVPTQPQVGIGENSSATLGWLRADSATGVVSVHAAGFKEGRPADPEATLSDGALGGVDAGAGFLAAADRHGDTVLPFVQAAGADRRLVAATWDRPPQNLVVTTSTNWRAATPLRWAPASDLWGLRYRVIVDGRSIGEFPRARFSPEGLIADGVHRWRVVAVDRRGQAKSGPARTLRIDGGPPRVALGIAGRRQAGSTLTLTARASDPAAVPAGGAPAHRRRGSGVARVRIDFGDGTPPVAAARAQHRYRPGTFTVRAIAVDRVGNRTVATRRITVRG